MKFCTNCGQPLPSDSTKFCVACGTPVDGQAQAPEHVGQLPGGQEGGRAQPATGGETPPQQTTYAPPGESVPHAGGTSFAAEPGPESPAGSARPAGAQAGWQPLADPVQPGFAQGGGQPPPTAATPVDPNNAAAYASPGQPGGAALVEPPKRGRKKLLVVLVAVVLILALVVTAVVIVLGSSDTNTLRKAYAKTFAAMGSALTATAIDDVTTVSNALQGGPNYLGIDLGFEVEGTSLSFVLGAHRDLANERMDLGLDFGYGVGLDMDVRGDEIYLSLRGLLDNVYALGGDNFAEDFNRSALREQMGLEPLEEETTTDLFNYGSLGDVSVRAAKLFSELVDGMAVEKGAAGEVNVRGQILSCTEYTSLLTAEQISRFFDDLEELYLDDPMARAYYMANGLEDAFDTLRYELVHGDWTIRSYIHKGYAVKTEIDVQNRYGDTWMLEFSTPYMDDIMREVYFGLLVEEDAGIDLIWSLETGENGWSQQVTMALYDGGYDRFNADLSTVYSGDSTGGDLDISFVFVNERGGEMALWAEGSIGADTESNRLTLDLPEIGFSIQDLYTDESLAFDCYIVWQPDGNYEYENHEDAIWLVDLSESELEAIMSEILLSIFSMSF